MALKMMIEISDADLEHYEKILEEAAERAGEHNESQLITNARELMGAMGRSEITGGVRKRLDDLATLIAMLEDREWRLEGDDRRRVVAVLSYFTNALDVIPDSTPGLGYVDDALMTELVLRELRHDLEGYRDFCAYRAKEEQLRREGAHVTRSEWLAAKRRQVLLRIKRRRQERRRHGSRDAPTPPLLAFRP